MEFYTASLSAFRARCLACTISGFYALVPQLTSYSLKKHNNTNTSLFAMAKWLKEAMYCSVSAALMPFAGTTEQGLLQSISGYCSYLSVTSLQLIAVLAFFYCLSPPRAHTDSARHRAGLAGHTATSDRYPLCFQHPPRRSRQELQHHHNLNTNRTARLNLPTLFLGNGFLRKPGPQTLILRSSAAHGQSSRWGTGGAELSVPSG